MAKGTYSTYILIEKSECFWGYGTDDIPDKQIIKVNLAMQGLPCLPCATVSFPIRETGSK